MFPSGYKYVHGMHHEFVGSTVWATEHAHWIEQVLGGIGAHMQFSQHPSLLWMVWLIWRTQDSAEHHSGYCFKGTLLHRLGLLNAERTEFHDWHHTHPHSGNFGTHLGLDFLMRTSDSWMIELQRRREKENSCGTTFPKETLFPNSPEKEELANCHYPPPTASSPSPQSQRCCGTPTKAGGRCRVKLTSEGKCRIHGHVDDETLNPEFGRT